LRGLLYTETGQIEHNTIVALIDELNWLKQKLKELEEQK